MASTDDASRLEEVPNKTGHELEKWSPLRSSHSDSFREMEERHDSLLLPPEGNQAIASRRRQTGGLPTPPPEVLSAKPKASDNRLDT